MRAGVPALEGPSREEVLEALDGTDTIVDCMLGTGFYGTVRTPFDIWIECVNSSDARVVAVDVPSGLSAQTGKAAEPCLKAHKTVTMITSKPGLETPYAFAFCGTVRVAPLAYIEPILEGWKQQEA